MLVAHATVGQWNSIDVRWVANVVWPNHSIRRPKNGTHTHTHHTTKWNQTKAHTKKKNNRSPKHVERIIIVNLSMSCSWTQHERIFHEIRQPALFYFRLNSVVMWFAWRLYTFLLLFYEETTAWTGWHERMLLSSSLSSMMMVWHDFEKPMSIETNIYKPFRSLYSLTPFAPTLTFIEKLLTHMSVTRILWI